MKENGSDRDPQPDYVFPELVKLNEWVNIFAEVGKLPIELVEDDIEQITIHFYAEKLGSMRAFLTWYNPREENSFRDETNSIVILPDKIIAEKNDDFAGIVELEDSLKTRLFIPTLSGRYESDMVHYRFELGLDGQPIVECTIENIQDEDSWYLDTGDWRYVEKVNGTDEQDDLLDNKLMFGQTGWPLLPEDPRFLANIQIRIIPTEPNDIPPLLTGEGRGEVQKP